MAATVQSFNKGINTDMAIANMLEGTYRMAKNFTFTNTGGEGTDGGVGALVNAASNNIVISYPSNTTDIVGYINIGDDIVYFFKDTNTRIDSIYLYTTEDNSWTLLYSDQNTPDGSKLNFDLDYKITGIGKVETSKIKKVYWTDGLNEVRYLDLNRDYLNPTVPTHHFSLLPNVYLGSIYTDETKLLNGGNLKAGAVQYVYKLFRKNGAETLFSSTTRLIRLTNYTPGGSSEFYGADIDEIINKSVEIEFSDIDTSFDYIKVYAIFYNSYSDLPHLYLVQETEVNSSDFKIIDSGDYPKEYSLEELNTVGTRLFVASDLAEKNNYLFASDIKEIYFDADIDCRAYRYDVTTNHALLEDTDGTTITVDPDGFWSGS